MRLGAIGRQPSDVPGNTAKPEGPEWRVEGLKRFLRVLSSLPKDLQNDTRDASQQIASDIASKAQNAAHTPLQNLAATTLKAKRDRIPVVQSTGSVRKGVKAQDIFYGAEFGGGRRPTTRQFLPHRGTRGYFFYPTVRANSRRAYDQWADAVDKAFKQWQHSGGE
jgi:CRP-like cAMP-binding protein